MDASEPLAAAAALLPAWTGWSNALVFVPGAFAVGMLSAWCGGRLAIGPLRAGPAGHWTERARLAQPVRGVACVTALLPALVLGGLAAWRTGPLSHLPPACLGLLAACAAYLGSFLVRRGLEHEVRGSAASAERDLLGELVGWLLCAPHVLVALLMLIVLARPSGGGLAGVCVLGAALLALVALFGGLPPLRWLGAARPAPGGLRALVADVARRTGVEVRGVWVLSWPVANAVALPATREVAFSESALAVLDDAELAAVAAHELGHLAEPRPVRVLRQVAVLLWLPIGAWIPIAQHLGAFASLLAAGLWYAAFFALQSAGRRLEERADAIARATGGQPGDLARALEKLHRANLAPALTRGGHGSHPDLWERMRAAGVEPAFPKPGLPSAWRSFASAALAGVVLGLGAAGLASLPAAVRAAAAGGSDAGRLFVAASGGRGLLDLGVERSVAGASQEAAVLLRAAIRAEPTGHHAPAALAELLATQGLCEEAARSLDVATARSAGTGHVGRCRWLEDALGAVADCRGEAVRLEASRRR
jgi:Zn-dependent protease with chaperone function